MNQGAIEQFGTPQEIYRRPRTAFVPISSVDELLSRHAARADGSRSPAFLRLSAAGRAGAGSKVALCIRPEDVRVRDLPADIANR
jgi:iron(III) transport system ATP-binding protein